jgi:hypothetical protein
MKIAFRKWLILKDAFFVVGARKEPELLTKKEKREPSAPFRVNKLPHSTRSSFLS